MARPRQPPLPTWVPRTPRSNSLGIFRLMPGPVASTVTQP